jgi:hypothetical protein
MARTSSKRFRYPLDPVLRKTNWELDGLKIEETQAKKALQDKEKEADRVASRVTEAESELRALCWADSLNPDRLQAVRLFLRERQAELAKKRREVEQAKRVHDQVFDRLVRTKKTAKGLADHRTRKQRDHQLATERDQIKVLDDLWVMSRWRSDQ